MFTRITPSHNGREALQYARGIDNKGHNNKEHRNLCVGGVNMLPDDQMSYEDQMEVFWRKASAKHKIQVRRIIGSFSKNELDPEDPNSKYAALEMAMKFSEQFYPDRQAAIFIQDDGVGGCLHFHLIVNDCSMTDNKGCSNDQQKYWYVEKHFDEIAKNYFELDNGDKAKDKVTQSERRKRQENEDYIKNGEDEKVSYIWKDDLKDRIRRTMETAINRKDFIKKLATVGVEAEFKKSKKYGEYITYELKDLSKFQGEIPKKSTFFKARSYKMGEDFGIGELDRIISKNNVYSDQHVIMQTSSSLMFANNIEKEYPRIKQKMDEEKIDIIDRNKNKKDLEIKNKKSLNERDTQFVSGEKPFQITTFEKTHIGEKNDENLTKHYDDQNDPKQAELNLITVDLLQLGEIMEHEQQIISELKNVYQL